MEDSAAPSVRATTAAVALTAADSWEPGGDGDGGATGGELAAEGKRRAVLARESFRAYALAALHKVHTAERKHRETRTRAEMRGASTARQYSFVSRAKRSRCRREAKRAAPFHTGGELCGGERSHCDTR